MARPWRSVSSHKDIRPESKLAIPPGQVTDLFLGVSTYLPTQANSKGDVVSNARVSLSISHCLCKEEALTPLFAQCTSPGPLLPGTQVSGNTLCTHTVFLV